MRFHRSSPTDRVRHDPAAALQAHRPEVHLPLLRVSFSFLVPHHRRRRRPPLHLYLRRHLPTLSALSRLQGRLRRRLALRRRKEPCLVPSLSYPLTSSWGWNRAEEHQTPLPRAAAVYSDFAVKDAARRCERVWTSPDGRYCVVSDALHRVVLLDLRSLVVLYLWKGWRWTAVVRSSYRAVQCLWTEARVEATGVKVPILLLFISSRTTAAFFTAESEPLLSRGVSRALHHSPVQPVLPLPVASRRLLHCSCVLDPEEKTVLFEKEEEGCRRVHCCHIAFQASPSLLDARSVIDHYHDVQHKNSLLRLLKQCAKLTDPTVIQEIMGIFGVSESCNREGQIHHRTDSRQSGVCESAGRLLPIRHRPFPLLRGVAPPVQRARGEGEGER